MNNKYIFPIAALVVLIGAGVYAQSTFASSRVSGGQYGSNYSPERHQQMLEIFKNNDYQAWKNLMGDKMATRYVNESNFPKFVEAHNLMLQGKYDEANKLRQEMGMPAHEGYDKGMTGPGRGMGMHRGTGYADANNDGICDRLQ